MEPECGEDLFLFFFSLHLNLRGKIPKLWTKICKLHLNLGPKFRNSKLKENQFAAKTFFGAHTAFYFAHTKQALRGNVVCNKSNNDRKLKFLCLQ